MKFIFLFLILITSNNIFSQDRFSQDKIYTIEEICDITDKEIDILANKIINKEIDFKNNLMNCVQDNYKLIFKIATKYPEVINQIPEKIRGDERFILRIIKEQPEILKYISTELKRDYFFMKKAVFAYRDALKYADQSLLDDVIFMEEMINLDSRNYIYGTEKIRANKKIAKIAFTDDGYLLKYAPNSIKSDKTIALVAINSNKMAMNFISIKDDKFIARLNKIEAAKNKEIESIKFFIDRNYIKTVKDISENISNHKIDNDSIKIAVNKNEFFKIAKIIDRDYVTKWQKSYKANDNSVHLIAVNSRNSKDFWKNDLKKYPKLVKKIENFFKRRNVDDQTIENLKLVYLYRVINPKFLHEYKNKKHTKLSKEDEEFKKNLEATASKKEIQEWLNKAKKEVTKSFKTKLEQNTEALVFNLYLLRESKDDALGDRFVNVTSLTAIASKLKNEEWALSVIEAEFDNEIFVDYDFTSGHKKYEFWDLYLGETSNDSSSDIINKEAPLLKNGKNLNKNSSKTAKTYLIFKVEDKFNDYLEVYEKQGNKKYKKFYSTKDI